MARLNARKGAVSVAVALLVFSVFIVYSVPVGSLTQSPESKSCPPDHKCKTTTTTTTTTTTETSTLISTQTAYLGPGPKFSPVTITMTSDTAPFNHVTGSCTTVTGYVSWNIGPIPPTSAWYVVQDSSGASSAATPLTLGPAYTQYGGSPPAPINAEFTAAPFTANVCGLQSSGDSVTFYASDPTDTFSTQINLLVG